MCRIKCGSLIVLATFWRILAVTGGGVVRNEDICGPHNGRRLYLELGERGILYARNVTFDDRYSHPATSYAVTAKNHSHRQCSLELVTCPSCVIVVTFESIALSRHCGDGGVLMDSPCRCDYVWLSEPPYEDVSGTPFCGSYSPIAYRSSTRTLSINLLYSQNHKHAFTIEYTAERNRRHLKGTEMASGAATKGSNDTGGGILTSPFFPARYPRDLGLEYIITCPGEAPFCRIRLLFSDFQLATVSIMEFYDWKGQRLDVSSGARFRPPVIMSSGPSLLIRFYANGGTGLGYKAFYSFVIGHAYDKSVQPITDCGGYVENLGGAITMMNMVGEGVKTYDCVWLIRPPKNFLHMRTHMYLKVVAFADMAGNTELIVKQGPTSALMSLEVVRHPASQLQPSRHREHVAPVASGFHVSLRGTFGPSSHLAIAYAAFSYADCFAGTDFLCQNHRCIARQLHCDGFDHCGDNSDEPATCLQNWEEMPRDRKWHMNKANYYFPKIDRYPDLKTATLMFVASSLGLIVLISALIILLYRIGARARQQRELQSRLETISELLDSARIDEISIPDDPPVYEAPPGYEEVVKLIVPRKLPRCSNRESFDRSCPSQQSEDANSIPEHCPTAEGASNDRGGGRTISGENERLLRVPESPPPPYVTPPGTVTRNVMAGLSASMRQICPVRRGGWLRRSAQSPQTLLGDVARSSPTADAPTTDHVDPHPSSPKEEPIVGENGGTEAPADNDRRDPEEIYGRVVDGIADGSDWRNVGCSCEGACGCSGLTRDVAFGDQSAVPPDPEQDRIAIASLLYASRRTAEECLREEEDRGVSKSAIVRLLGSKVAKPSYRGATATASSSLSGTPRRSPDGRQRGGCAVRIGACSGNSGGGSSYEIPRNGCEVASKATSVATWPPSCAPRRSLGRRRASCDPDSLYEGIGILDSYLARRSLELGHEHGPRQAVAVMLFGTPRHRGSARRCATRARLRARVWRSSEDATTTSSA